MYEPAASPDTRAAFDRAQAARAEAIKSAWNWLLGCKTSR